MGFLAFIRALISGVDVSNPAEKYLPRAESELPIEHIGKCCQKIPVFNHYFANAGEMVGPQRRFYDWLKSRLRRGECPDVDGNLSYLFVFLHESIGSYREIGYRPLRELLLRMAEGYSNIQKISEYCRYWANDCLLGMKQYELYLEMTEPTALFKTTCHPSNLRLNLQYHLGLEANPIDILCMMSPRKSKILTEYQGFYRDCLLDVFEEVVKVEGPWFDILKKGLDDPYHKYPQSLFSGVPFSEMSPRLDFDTYCLYSSKLLDAKVRELSREAENRVRELVELPKVGEGWISETNIYYNLKKHFSRTVVIQHGRPPWLGRQHFDIWFPEWNIAVEYHGDQHFRAVEFFGGVEAFAKNVERDERKTKLATRHGVRLFVITKDDDVNVLITAIDKLGSEANHPLKNTYGVGGGR